MTEVLPAVNVDRVPVDRLTSADWDQVWNLTRRYYETDREYVEQSLRAHQRLALFRRCSDGDLIGMAAVDVYLSDFDGRKLAVIFTSHVLLDERHRGQNLIQRVGFRTFLETRLHHPLRNIYWFFDTFSVKSYLLLQRNFRDYWPRHDGATPARELALANHLAVQAYGDAWRPDLGIVTRSGRKRLLAGTAPIEPHMLERPEVGFFVRSNPGHAEGDMLVCLCPLTARNWAHAAGRALARVRRNV